MTVQDQGVGIAGEHLERIFEPGFTTQEFGSGSGTGLLVVRQITQDMFGGSVKVDSAVGRGSTFERSEEHTSELQSHSDLVCRLLLEKKKNKKQRHVIS